MAGNETKYLNTITPIYSTNGTAGQISGVVITYIVKR